MTSPPVKAKQSKQASKQAVAAAALRPPSQHQQPRPRLTSRSATASIARVKPSTCIPAFQAQAACELSTRRLLSNSEWTQAAGGTPPAYTDNGTTDCNTGNLVPGPSNAGARSGCVSSAGAFDMLGNVWEWTVDPGAWHRGGDWGDGSFASVLYAPPGLP